MNNFRTIAIAVLPTTAWTAAATITGAPALVTVPAGLLLLALVGGLSALVSDSDLESA